MTPETQTPVERVSDLDGLEALARAATPGPWKATKHPESPFTDAIKADGRMLARCQTLFGRSHVPTAATEHNAAYIAAANPAVVLDLITRLRASEAATAAAVGWQDISTAPRDGTWIQAWRDPPGYTGGTWEPLVYVRWEDEEGKWVWPDDDYQVFTERGVELANMKIADFENYASDGFTHWQPLPTPPGGK